MNAALSTTTPHALSLAIPQSGEQFFFRTSYRGPSGRFAFQWRLAPGKVGPPSHVHPHETESFHVVSGRLQVIFDGKVHDLGPGEGVSVPPGTPHHFGHPGDEEAVVEVWLDGPRMEDQFVPLAARFDSPQRLEAGAVPQVVVHLADAMVHGANVPTSAASRGFMRAMAWTFGLFGVRPLPPVEGWEAKA